MNKGFLRDTQIKVTEGKITHQYFYESDDCVKVTLESGISFICGKEQLLFSNDEWIQADKSLGYTLSNGKKVTNIDSLEGQTFEMFDITVDNEEHDFYIIIDGEEIRVHNLPTMTAYLNAIVGGSSTRPVTPPTTNTSTSTVKEDTTIYIPSTLVQFTVSMLKPNTRLYVFFDNKDISRYVQPTGISEPIPENGYSSVYELITDSTGYASGTFRIPNNNKMKFIAGQREVVLTDSSTNQNPTTYAKASYIYTGTSENPDNPNLDSSISSDETNISPVIQSFYVGENGGMYVSKIGLFFYEKDSNQSMLLQIREVVEDRVQAGYIPGTSVTINPSNIVTNTDALNSTPTWVEFPNPVYLSEGKEYAIYLVTNSSNYIMHMVDYGKQTNNVTATKDISSRSFIKYAGINNWVRDNSRGLKYIIQKCQFDTTNTYNLALGNVALGTKILPNNSLSVRHGDNTITVTDPNHSFSVDGFVTISNLPPNPSSPDGNYAGIPIDQINGVHQITEVTWNTYSFNNYWTGNNYDTIYEINAANSDLVFGTGVRTDYDYQYDNLVLNINDLKLAGTSLTYQIKGQSGQSLDGSEQPYAMDSSSENIVAKTIFRPTRVKKVSSERNSDKFSVPGYKSLQVNATLSTNNPNVSPMIDKYNMNAIIVENLINNRNSTEFINNINMKGSVEQVSNLPPSSNQIGDAYIISTTGVTYVWDGEEWIVQGEACARRIWKTVNLYESASGLKVTFQGAIQANSDVSVYYKVLGVDENVSIDTKDWVKMELERDVTKSLNEYDYQQYSYLVDNLNQFRSFKVKLVMNSTDSTKVPLVKKFAAIAFDDSLS